MALAGALASSFAQAQTTELVSVATGGAQGNFGGQQPAISEDGRFVAFPSGASNLVAGDTNATFDIFVHDRRSGTTERVSVATGGAEGNLASRNPSISADGRFVVFTSQSSNLVAGDTNGCEDDFVRDRQSGTTERVSVATGGAQGNFASQGATMSADGRFVAFYSAASNLIAGDTNMADDIFVRDRQSGTTERVSVATGGAEGNSGSLNPSISADGRFVAFNTDATNLVAGDTNASADVFVRDRQNGTTERVSVATGGAEGNLESLYPSISADGRFVAFYSVATNLVAGDTNASGDGFVRDRQSGTTERVTVATNGAQGNADSVYFSISAGGRFVAFRSDASNLVAGDTNLCLDVFVHDRHSGTTERVSVDSTGAQANFSSETASISANGRFVAFQSDATNLVGADTNGSSDAFVRDRGATPGSPFCFGDGTGTACPCGNGAAGNGCPNSVDPSGGNLAASGTASTTADTLVLTGSGMPNSWALYFQGTTQLASGAGVVFGDGLSCAGGTVIRLDTQLNSGGTSHYPGAGDPSVSVRGQIATPAVRTYQVWYRNAAAFCTPATFNLTNGVEVVWML